MFAENPHTGVVEIICDKCGAWEHATPLTYNEQFYRSGWRMNMSAKKYKHICAECLEKDKQKAIPVSFESNVKLQTIRDILGEVLGNGSADREWIIKMLTRKYKEITGIDIPIKNI